MPPVKGKHCPLVFKGPRGRRPRESRLFARVTHLDTDPQQESCFDPTPTEAMQGSHLWVEIFAELSPLVGRFAWSNSEAHL